MNHEGLRRRVTNRTFVSVVGFTAVLTAAFVGLVALLLGEASGVATRLPYYVLAMAVAFVLALWRLDDRRIDGKTVLIGASGIAVGAALLFALAVEGVVHAVANPGRVLTSNLIVYFLAAALICTGLGAWSLRHWREFATVEDGA